MKTIHTNALFPSLTFLRSVATDLDGTLLRSDKTISERTITLLQRLRSAGVVILLVSARPPRVLLRIARAFHLGGLAICCNGAIIYDVDRDSFLQERLLSPQQVEHLVTLLSDSLPDLSFAAESGKSVACEAAFFPFVRRMILRRPKLWTFQRFAKRLKSKYWFITQLYPLKICTQVCRSFAR